MADIFVSYSHADRDAVERIVSAAEAQGFSVWIDRHLAVGSRFSQHLSEELDQAKAVIVAWSQNANQSVWVADEATVARDSGRLVPVSLDGSPPPLGFRQFQTLDFSKWNGEPTKAPFTTLVAALATVVRGASAAPQPAPSSHTAPTVLSSHSPAAFLTQQMPVRRNRALFIAGAAILVLGAGAAGLHFAANGGAPNGTVKTDPIAPAASIAVVPFANISADPAHAMFVDGLSDELISGLAAIEGLHVPGRNSCFYFKDKPAPASEVGRQLAVRYVLEGSVRRAGDALRIAVQLTDASTGYRVWSETYDRTLADIFAVQQEIATQVVKQLPGVVGAVAAAQPGVDPRAHELFLVGLGRMHARYAGAGWQLAYQAFKAALDIDPDYPLANAYYAVTATMMDGAPAEATRALSIAAAALPDNPDVLFAQGFVAKARGDDGTPDLDKARDYFDRALAADPSHSEALHARISLEPNRQKALKLYQKLIEIDPLFFNARLNYASTLANMGRWEEADREFGRIYELRPETGREGEMSIARAQGKFDLLGKYAFENFDRTRLKSPDRFIVAGLLADLGATAEAKYLYAAPDDSGFYALPGQRDVFQFWVEDDAVRARDVIARMDFAKLAPVSIFGAIVAAQAGDADLAIRLVENAFPDIRTWDAKRIRNAGALPAQMAVRVHAIGLNLRGERKLAAQQFRALLAASGGSPASPADLQDHHIFRAVDFAQLGDKPSALKELRSAVKSGWRYPKTFALLFSPWPSIDSPAGFLAPLRDEPEFKGMMAEIRSQNAAALKNFEKEYGILTRVRVMKAEDAKNNASKSD